MNVPMRIRAALLPLTVVLALACVGCRAADSLTPSPTASPRPMRATPTKPPPTDTPPPTATITPSPTATFAPPAIIGPDDYPDNVNPLTGLVVDDPTVLERRPLIVKISNFPPVVRPQSGISFADMVFEHYAEGGVTRFTAIFYSQGADHIGSVRSVRLVDLQLTPAYDGILIFSGGSNGVIDTIRQSPIYPDSTLSPQFGYGEPWFVRFPREGLPYEHTLFTDTALLWDWADERGVNRPPRFSTPGMAFWEQVPDGGTPTGQMRLDYARTTATWRFDPLSGQYLRWTEGEPHTDALTGKQLAFSNILVISAYHEQIELFPEKYFGEEESLLIEITGEGGPVTLLRDGQAFEGHWVREGDNDQITYYDLNGDPLLLKPGKTFVHIIRVGFEQLWVEP